MATRDEILRILNEAGCGFVSGEEISRRLNVTRAAVWKHIRALADDGAEIEAVTHRGYRLKSPPNVVRAALVEPHLKTRVLGRNASFIESAPSSNAIIRRMAEQGAVSGTMAVVEDQTGGRGRRGRGWLNSPGLDICVSLLIKPNIETQYSSRFTLAAALGTYKMLKHFGLDPVIKWPNDVLAHGKKLCGILLELQGSMEALEFIIVGIGLNINTICFPEQLSEYATSMKREAGREFERAMVLAELLNALEPLFDSCADDGDFALLLQQYRDACVTIGKEITLTGLNEVIEGTAKDVDAHGHLILVDSAGKTHTAAAGDVTLRA